MKQYRELEFIGGMSIENAVDELLKYKDKGILAKASFNGVMLYSDTVTLDTAYREITGKGKQEYDDYIAALQEERRIADEKHKADIPRLTEEYIKQGKEILDEDKWELWEKCVPIRLADLYQGMELKCALDIIKMFNEDKPFEEVKEVFISQGHSGMSAALLFSMLVDLSPKGKDFVDKMRR